MNNYRSAKDLGTVNDATLHYTESRSMIENRIVVHSRSDWKRAITTNEFLKRLSKIGIVGKENCIAQPHEVMNLWTIAFAHDENGRLDIIEYQPKNCVK